MKNVTIYSTPSCHYCKLAKEFLTAKNIAYTEHNVAAAAQKRTEMIEKTGQMGVPVIEVGDELMVGYDEGQLSSLLGI